jgi:hypothetical protein
MKINSEKLFNYINELPTGKKVKFAVYYDDNYTTEVDWDGENFNWENGMFTSGAFFNQLYDFEILNETDDEFEDIKITDICHKEYGDIYSKINQLIRNQKKIIERLRGEDDE